MMKKREAWLLGHGWNKFSENDTFMIDLFSVGSSTGVADLVYGSQEYVIDSLKNLDNFKQGLSLFAEDRNAKIKERVIKAKEARKKKSKEPVEDEVNTVDLSTFVYDSESKYNKANISEAVDISDKKEIFSQDYEDKVVGIRDSLLDWEERVNGTKKSKTVPLVMRCFAL
jgi:hypothetical protein